MTGNYLAIDVGGSSIKYACIDVRRRLTEYGRIKTPLGQKDAYIDALVAIYEKFRGCVDGIAMSVPGIIDSENGICVTTGALKLGANFPLVQTLEERCGIPVTIINDAKAAALAEANWGALAGYADGIVIVLGTGVGGALIKDGKVHMGKHFSAGEFSTISLDQNPDAYDHTWMGFNGNRKLITTAAYAKGVEPDTINGEDVFRWVNEGDPAVCQALDRFTASLAMMVRNLQLIFDPERIAIGGGISRQPKLMESLKKNLDYHNRMASIYGMPEAEVVPCCFFNDANLIGAYAYYIQSQSLWQNNKKVL